MPRYDYFCGKCYRGHKLTSKIGRAHKKYGDEWLEKRRAFDEKYGSNSP